MKIKYENAKVYTGQGFADSFIVDTETGKFCEGPFDKVVDLGGKFVCAGFTDSHMPIRSSTLAASSFAPDSPTPTCR